MREDRIEKYSAIFMIVLAVFTIYYQYRVFSGLLNYSFLQPERMLRHRYTGGYVDMQVRWTWFVVWLVPILLGLCACLVAMYVVNLSRLGQWTGYKFARGLSYLGVALLLAMSADVIAGMLRPMILSLANPNESFGVMFRFNNRSFALIMCGMAFYALGWMMQEAVKIREENNGFV